MSVTATSSTGIGTVNTSSNVGVGNYAITGQTTAQISTLQLGTQNFALAPSATFSVNGILKAGNSTGGTLSGGYLQPATLNGDLVVRTDMASDTLTVSSPILANGTNDLVKSGSGTLTLSGTNNLTGGLFLNGGMLAVSATNGSNLGVAGARSPSTAARSVPRSTGLAIDTTSSPRPVSVNPSGGTIQSVSGNPTITINGNLSGSGPLQIGSTSNGSHEAICVFTGANSNFTGTIYGGYGTTLTFAGSNSTGSGAVTANGVYGATIFKFKSDSMRHVRPRA